MTAAPRAPWASTSLAYDGRWVLLTPDGGLHRRIHGNGSTWAHASHRTPDNDDTFIPEPMYFARALGWTKGWSRAWSWLALTETAGELYWQRRPRPAVDDVAA